MTGGDIWQERRALLEEAREALGDCVSPLRVRVTAKLADVLAGLEPGPRGGAQPGGAAHGGTAGRRGGPGGRSPRPPPGAGDAGARRRAGGAGPPGGRAQRVGGRHHVGHGRTAGELADLVEPSDLAGFDAEFADYADAARELRRPHDLWRSAVMRAMRALFDGRLDEGAALADEASELGVRLQQPGAPGARRPGLLGVVAPGPGR